MYGSLTDYFVLHIFFCFHFSNVVLGPAHSLMEGGRDVMSDSSGYYSVIHTEKQESWPDE